MSNFHALEVVERGSETQLQVGKNLVQITLTILTNNIASGIQKGEW